jgi:neutral ceramidase
MRRRRDLLQPAVVAIALAIGSGGLLSAEPALWKAGTAKAKITPEKPMYLAGYGSRDAAAEGTLHDIWVKVLTLRSPDGHRAAVITSDVCGFSKRSYETICAELKNRCGLDRAQIMLTCSHTHTGPALDECLQDYGNWDATQRARIEQYTRALEKTIVDTVAKAFSDSEQAPATLWAGQGMTDFAVNRRNNPEADVPKMRLEGVAPKGPLDHSVPVLAVRSPDGKLRAVLFGYACHTTTLSLSQWSGDFAGYAQIALEATHPGAQAMFCQGCGADQNPIPRRTVELCQKYGRMLTAAVNDALGKPMRPIAPTLRTAIELVDLPFEHTPTPDEFRAIVAKGGIYGRWAQRMLDQLGQGKTLAKSHPYAIGVWRLGDQLWISLAGEAVVDYSLKFKAKYGPNTWVTAFASDLTAYIPSRRVWDEGGYEGGALGEYGLPAMRWDPSVEQRITAGVERLEQKVR